MSGYEVDIATLVALPRVRRVLTAEERPRLGSSLIADILRDRYFSPSTWDMQIHRFDGGDTDSAVTALESQGVGTEVAIADATNKGWLLETGVIDDDNTFIYPHITGNKMGIASYWSSDLSPFCIASVLCGPVDAQQLVEAEYVVGLDIIEAVAGKDAAASGETDAARWQVTNGAAGGVATNWKCEVSTASGTDAVHDPGAAFLSQRATFVELAVFVSAARTPHFFYDGKLVHVGTALDAATIMAPSIGVQVNNTTGDDAKAMVIRWLAFGQRYSA